MIKFLIIAALTTSFSFAAFGTSVSGNMISKADSQSSTFEKKKKKKKKSHRRHHGWASEEMD